MVAVFITLIILFVCYLILIKPNIGNKERTHFLMGHNIARAGLYDNQSDRPENSLPAFKSAIAANYAIETQVGLSSDGVLVAFADKNLLRLTGVSTNVGQMTWKDLSTLHLLNTRERIVTLEELFFLVDGIVPLVLDIRSEENEEEMVLILSSILKTYQGKCAVESSNKKVLIAMKNLLPEIPRGLRASGPAEEDQSFLEAIVGAFLLTNIQTRPDFISYYFRKSKNFSLRLCKGIFHVPIVGWTIQNMDDYRTVDRIFDGLIFEHITPSNQFVKGKINSKVVSPPIMAQQAERKDQK